MKPNIGEIIGALNVLGLNGDKIFERIQRDMERGLMKEARSHLNFIDAMVEAEISSMSVKQQTAKG